MISDAEPADAGAWVTGEDERHVVAGAGGPVDAGHGDLRRGEAAPTHRDLVLDAFSYER
jgi:hypothetical protein